MNLPFLPLPLELEREPSFPGVGSLRSIVGVDGGGFVCVGAEDLGEYKWRSGLLRSVESDLGVEGLGQ